MLPSPCFLLGEILRVVIGDPVLEKLGRRREERGAFFDLVPLYDTQESTSNNNDGPFLQR